MKGIILYRILSVLVNIFSFFLAISMLFAFPVIFAQPIFAIVFFMMVCVVLYTWFANIFLKKVLIKKETISKKTKDLIQVNAIVSMVMCFLIIVPGLILLADPKPYFDALDQMMQGQGNAEVTPQMATNQLWVFIICFILLAAHIVWTYLLIRKNADYIEK